LEKKTARNFFIWGTLLSTLVFLWLTFDTHTTIPQRTNEDKLTDAVVQGKIVWHNHNCNDCHTILGIGGYYSPDVTKAYSSRGEVWLRVFLKNSESSDPDRRKMPDQNLTADEVNKLVSFLKWVDALDTNHWPPKPVIEAKTTGIGMTEESQTVSGKKVFDQYRCELCHKIGDTGGVIGPDLSHVGSKQDSRWISAQIRDPKSHNPNTLMPAYPQIPEAELNVLVSYLAGLK
jgi:nitric oxide reductase subunit C